MNVAFEVKGFEHLQDVISQIGNAPKLFDRDFAKNARQMTRLMIEKTPKKTGTTARGWSTPKKIYDSSYVVSNETSVHGFRSRFNMALILDRGRGEVRPIQSKNLYIPLSQKGMAKRAGDPIPRGLVYGKDYILAKKAKATKGKNFIGPATLTQSKVLVEDMQKTIRGITHGPKNRLN